MCLSLTTHSHGLEVSYSPGKASVSSLAVAVVGDNDSTCLVGGFRARYLDYQHRAQEMMVLTGGNDIILFCPQNILGGRCPKLIW